VFPEAVHDSAGVLGVTYQDMIVVNTAAMKELMAEVQELRTRVKRLEDARPWFRGHARDRQIEERLRRLEQKIN
jgi:exonuclease VII small subunit